MKKIIILILVLVFFAIIVICNLPTNGKFGDIQQIEGITILLVHLEMEN